MVAKLKRLSSYSFNVDRELANLIKDLSKDFSRAEKSKIEGLRIDIREWMSGVENKIQDLENKLFKMDVK